MKPAIITVIPLILLLTACPGEGDRLAYSNWRPVFIYQNSVCFSINKNNILSSYSLEYIKDRKSILLLNSREDVHISYPETCFNINLKPGYRYGTLYILDKIKYRYEFIIDNNGNIINLKGVH